MGNPDEEKDSNSLNDWLGHPQTSRLYKNLKSQADMALQQLNEACLKSTDPLVRERFAVLIERRTMLNYTDARFKGDRQ
jgi:hypothetical protein